MDDGLEINEDAELGPVFNDAIANWPEHLDKPAAFRSSVILATGRCKGNPMSVHLKHKGRTTPELFQRRTGAVGSNRRRGDDARRRHCI